MVGNSEVKSPARAELHNFRLARHPERSAEVKNEQVAQLNFLISAADITS
jgi:hypothetical protein